ATSVSFNITAGSPVSIEVSAGDNQTAAVGTAFAAPLEAIVFDAHKNPVPNASVIFTAPASGPSATFAGSFPAAVTTNGNGIAISPVVTANSQSGSFQMTAITNGPVQGAIFTLTNAASTANKLAFIDQPPTNIAAGMVMAPVTVQLQDSFGNAVHMPGIAIT